MIRVITKDDSDTYHVHLHITMTCGNSFCVNDELVSKKYAVYTDEEAIFSGKKTYLHSSPILNGIMCGCQ